MNEQIQWTRSMHEKNKKCVDNIKFWFGNLKGRDYLRHLSFVGNHEETGCKNMNWNLQVS
jgi:hypothetical protein